MVRLLACVGMLLTLCGCFDYNELNMQELVNGAGIDKDGETVNIRVLCAATGSKEEKTGAVYTSSGKSFFDAVREITGKSDKKLYWGHAKCLVIGESAANSIDEILDTVLRAQDVYLDIAPVIAKGETAEKILSSEPAGGRDTVESISGAFANEDNSRRFRARRVWEILREREEEGFYILPTVELRNRTPVLSGGAVMRDGRLAGYLSGEQMLILSLMTEKTTGGYLPPLALPDGRQVSFEILANDVKKREDGDTLHIEQSCMLSPAEVRGEVTEDEMRQAAKKFLEASFSELSEFAKAEKLGDIFGYEGKSHQITCDVRISNILGGK